MDNSQPRSRVLKWSLIIGITIVSNLFVNYAISLVYKAPLYEKYCPTQQVNQPVTTQEACVAKGGQWNGGSDQFYMDPTSSVPKQVLIKNPGYCNENYTCQKNFDTDREGYDRNIFIILTTVGVLLIIGSFLSRTNAVVSTALSFAGVLSLIIASMRYWSQANDWLKVLILGLALAALIALAVRKFKGQ